MKGIVGKVVWTLLAVLISFAGVFAQGRPAAKKTPAAKLGAPFLQHTKFYEETAYVTKVLLKNGMTILINEFRAHPVISLQAYVRVGILDEPLGRPGVANLLAAMLCRGSPDVVKGTLRQNVQALGGLMKCSVDWEDTKFEIVAPSSQWRKALGILMEALSSPYLGEEEIKLEAGIIAGTAREIMDDPYELAFGRLVELAFNQPRLNRWKMLAGEPLANLGPADLHQFYKAALVPEKIMLVISGDVTPGEVLNELVKIYSPVTSGGLKTDRLFLGTRQESFRYAIIEGDIPYPRLLVGFHIAPDSSADSAALQVLNAILGMGEGSILATRLRDQKKIVLAASTSLMMRPKFGYLSIELQVRPDDIDRSEIALFTEIELLKREEPSEAEMARAVAQLEIAFWSHLETVSERAQTLARFESAGDWKRMDRYLAELRQVKAADVRRVAARYLRLDNCALVEYLPFSAERRKPEAQAVRDTLEGLLKASADQEQAERNRETVRAVKIPGGTARFKFSEIRYPFLTASILRGPEMYIREDHTSPVVNMGIFFPGGRSAEQEDNYGITWLLVRMMLRGAGGRPAAQFYRQLEIYGCHIRPVVAPDFFGFYFSILSRNLEESLPLLLEIIKNPNLDPEEITGQKETQIAKILSRRHSIDYPAERMFQALFKNSHYSADPLGTVKSIAAIDAAALRKWYEAYVKNRKPLVVTIGDTKGSSLASYFVQHFSGSRMQAGKIPEEFAKPLEKGELINVDWPRAQSLILIGFQAPSVDDEDSIGALVLQNYVGNSGKFVQEIRDRTGVAYEVSVVYEPLVRGGNMVVRGSANPGNEEAALKALREQIERLTGEAIAYRDYRSAVSSAAGAYWINGQSRFAQTIGLVKHLLAGHGIEEYQSLGAKIQAVRPEDLEEIARRIFNMDRAVILLVRGRSAADRAPAD